METISIIVSSKAYATNAGTLHCRVVLPRMLFLTGATGPILTLVASDITIRAAEFSGVVGISR